MKRIVSISLGSSQRNYHCTTTIIGQKIEIQRIGTDGDVGAAARLLRTYDGHIDAFGLSEPPPVLRLGTNWYPHRELMQLASNARTTPVLDGSSIQATLGRWMIQRVGEVLPGIFRARRVLFINGTESYQQAQALVPHQPIMRFADPMLLSGTAAVLAIRSLQQLEQYAATVLPLLMLLPVPRYCRLFTPHPRHRHRLEHLFQWAEVIVGRCETILNCMPDDLGGRTILTDAPSPGEVEQLAQRGVSTLVTLTPPLSDDSPFVGADVLEAIVAVVQGRPGKPDDSDVLHVITAARWEPAIHPLNPAPIKPSFAFVVHPITPSDIYHASFMQFARRLPQRLVEWASAYAPPIRLSRIRGIRSTATGKEIEGILLTLGSTPREIMRRPPEFTYRRLLRAAQISEQMGAGIMGLGAFTSVVGDAGVTVARRSSIGITTGNALTVAVTLDTIRSAVEAMQGQLEQCHVIIVGATGSIGAVCARMLAMTTQRVVLIAPRPERLLALKYQIERETPQAQVCVATLASAYLASADVIILATSAFDGELIDVSRLKPGSVVCDVSRPANISRTAADRRPDVLFIESGEIHLPGTLDMGFNINLPPGSAYACLAETALLALEGHFDDYTLGRSISIERVKEMHALMKKHGIQPVGLCSFGCIVSETELNEKRRLANALRHSAHLETLQLQSLLTRGPTQ